MDRDNRSLDLGSSLLDASVADGLPVEAKVRARKAKHDEREQHSQLAPAGPGPRRDEGRTLAATNGLTAHAATSADVPVDVNDGSPPAAPGLSITASITAGWTATHDGESLSPPQADDRASFVSPLDDGAGTASAQAAPVFSSSVVILETAPSAKLAADVVGSSMPAAYLPVAQANITLCCGACGYINCPTQLLSQAPGNALPLSGQLPGSGADFVSTGQNRILAGSMSDPMLSRQVAPVADWNGQLPGGGETATGSMTGQIGILSGTVTAAVVPQVKSGLATEISSNPLAAAAATTNPIVLENQKVGNPESEWGIDGAGDSNIEGFATDISVNHGNTINFKINTNSSNYRIDIYRLGYYDGLGARKVATLQHTGVQNQPAPLRDATTGEVDAGNWAVSASWAVPADAVSGVYIAKLTRQDGTAGENHIPFIVRDDSSHSDVLFQTADETWQAYNGWGGANFYGGNGPATGQGAGRAYALSYNRPIATRGGVGTFAGPQDYLFGAEYASISWLEQNGYDVSYMAGVDVDRFGSLLLNHKVYVDTGHDEYWSGQQRTNVEAARDAGVNLQFWSGNEVYWRTRWGNALSSDATPYRTLISYKETWANSSIDPTNQWTGTFRDPRFSPPAIGGGSPENALTGTIFQVDDVGGNLESITIPYDDANLRFWANTSVANLQPGQTATLTKNYLGYEWDEAPDNGFDPAGLVKLSSTTLPVNSYLLDYGNTTGSGVATHSLTLYRAPSGALVFGAGTVYWSWGLSDNHDKEVTPTDPRVQQAMVNLFADMGIQPATLQSGLIAGTQSTDNTAPTSAINSPGTGATFTAGQVVTVSGTASDVGGVIAGVEVSTDNGISWHPATGDETWTYTWSPQVAGTYTIRSRAVDDSINLETPSGGRTVTVTGPSYFTLFPGSATPAIVNTTDASAVELGVKFQTSVAGTVSGIRFYKSSQDTGVHTGELWTSSGTQLATATFINETASGWQTVNFASPVTVTPGAIYTASYHTNVGHYSNSENYFTTNVTSGPLTAPASGNGVYAYGSTSLFPTSTFSATNYWVDVVFNISAPNTSPTAVADTANATEKGGIANGSGGSPASGNVLTNDTDPDAGDTKTVTAVSFGAVTGTLGTALAGAHGSLVLSASGAFTYTVNETDPAVQGLRQSADTVTDGFSYTMRDTAGATSTTTLTVSIHGANDAPALAVQTGSQNAVVGSAFSLVLPTGTFSDVDASDTLTYTATAADGSALPAWLPFDAATRTFSGTPTAADVGTLGVKVSATDLGSLAASETFNIVVTTTPDAAPTAVADTADATEKGGIANGSGGSPASGNVLTNDTDPDAGDTKTVTAVSFGAVAGTLGTALAGAHGSLVLDASGAFTYTVNETDAAVQALRQATDTLSDVFSYTMRDTAGVTSTTTLTVTIHGANDAPTLAAQTGSQNATVGSVFSLVLPGGTFTDVDAGDSLTYTTTAADGSSLPAWLSFNAATRTFSGTPTTGDAGTLGVKVSATDLGGLAASETFNIVVATPPTTVSLFTASNTPALTDQNDGSPIEVGVKFQSSVAGQITALKFYRSPGDTGSDLLDLWTSTGTNLASVTFTNTAASGWQSVSLATPVAISANTTYVASYHTSGFYVVTDNFFTTAFTSGVLTAPSTTTAGGNGVYAYGGTSTTGIFPTNTFSAANYWADVVFASSASNTSPTAVADTANATEKGGIANGSGGSPASGNVLTNDTDPDAGDTKTVTAVSFGAVTGTLGTALAGAHGSLVLSASGAFTYTVNETDPAVQGLRQSTDTVTDGFSYTMRDTAGATSTTTLTVSIHGANDAPALAVQTGSQNAVVGSAFSLVLPTGTFSDVDASDTLTYTATAADGSALPAWLPFDAATRTFSGTPTAADVGTLGVKVSATDLGSLAASETFNIVVTTTPDAAPTAVADTADATEKGGIANGSGGSPASGNVLTNDTDPDAGDTKTVTAVSFGAVTGTLGTALAGAHGSLVLDASGAFTYTVNETDAAVQALRQSTDTLSDVFSYTMRDTAGATSATTLTVSIHGANDAPTISNLAVSATSISFVASDPDNTTLSLASPFASAFGNPTITSGATTSLTPSVRTTAVSGTLQVTDGSAMADVIGLYLGTGGNDTATAPNPTAPNAMYGFGGNDTLPGGAAADSIFGGAGADTLSGGAGNDTFFLANGDFASGESIDGGADADAIVLTNATTVNFTSGTVGSIETLTGSSGNDTITMSATQWAGFSTINLGSGTNVLNVVASGDISAGPTPTVSNVTTGNLTGTSGNDTITLTGAQLDAIIVGSGTINLGTGTDTINLTSTSADLNTLGATNASIQGVEAISAATAGSGLTITLSGQTEGFTITGTANNDTITGGRGADTMTGGTGVDRFVFNSASSPGTVGGSGDTGTITGYDVITDFSPNAGGDVLDMPSLNVRANEIVNGTNSVLTIASQTIKSHQINNGIITFSNNDTFSSGATFSLASLANVAAAVNYIHLNDFATSTGANIGFVANIGGTAHTYIFNQIGNGGSTANDILVDLVGVTLTSFSGANLAPAGVAGEAINLGLTNPTDHLGSITVNISGVPSGWTMSEGSDKGDGTWSVQTYDVSALSITAPKNYAGAVSLQMSQTWTDSTGGTGLAMINNNVEAYASGAPIFAISGDDNLSGSSENDVFVLARPIGNDTIHSFDFSHDKVDLIGFNGLSSFVDVQTRLSENGNGDAVITIAESQSIIFDGVSPESLTADNFVFNLDTVMSNANSIVIGDNAVLPLAGIVNNSSTIELASTGSQTRLQVLANGLTLEGGGHVDLSDGNGNIIVGTTPDATLTNVDNTISGAGQLGEGQLTLHNKGTIIASDSNALTIDTGTNEVINSGTLRATGSGGLVIYSDLANSGLLWANGGNITIDGNVTSAGSVLIDGVATFEMGGAFGENVTLDAGANATLKIDHAANFSGAVAGFDGNDVFDLMDIAFGSNTTLGYAANSNNTGGTLTASDGTHTANIELLGQYMASSFAMSADGVGGTLIHDLPPATLTHTLTQPQHA